MTSTEDGPTGTPPGEEQDDDRRDGPAGEPDAEPDAEARHVAERAELLPEERAAGSEAPLEQAALLLEESEERTEHPDPDASKQSGRRTSADSAD